MELEATECLQAQMSPDGRKNEEVALKKPGKSFVFYFPFLGPGVFRVFSVTVLTFPSWTSSRRSLTVPPLPSTITCVNKSETYWQGLRTGDFYGFPYSILTSGEAPLSN
jgi:hypothetical protein